MPLQATTKGWVCPDCGRIVRPIRVGHGGLSDVAPESGRVTVDREFYSEGMSLQPGGDGRGPDEWPTMARMDSSRSVMFPRWTFVGVLVSFALILATFLIAGWRPLFGGSGFGLVIELVSCAAGIILALAAIITSVSYLTGHQLGRRNPGVVVAVVGTSVIVGAALLLDIVAASVVASR